MKKRSSAVTVEERKAKGRQYLTPLSPTTAHTSFHPLTLGSFSAVVEKAIPSTPEKARPHKGWIGQVDSGTALAGEGTRLSVLPR